MAERRPFLYRGPLFVLVASLVLTAGATIFLWLSEQGRDQLRFQNQAQRTQAAVQTRMQIYLALLRATAGFLRAEGSVTPGEFRTFISDLEVERHYPGIQGVGFTLRVPASRLAEVEARIRRDRGAFKIDPSEGPAPEFRVWPEDPRPEYHSIILLEPSDKRNLAALGFDMFTEATRRRAMERARDTGEPAASGRVTLKQEIEGRKQPGFLIYLPLYEGPRGNLQERRASLRGFVYSPFRSGDLLEGILEQPANPSLAYRLYAGTELEEEALLYATPQWPTGRPSHRLVSSFPVAGFPWTLEFVSLPPMEAESASFYIPWLGLFGVGMSGVLFASSASQVRARRRAEEAQAAAEAAERRLSMLSEASDALGTSVDFEPALQVMAERMVPDMADWCAVDLVDDAGPLRRVALAHRDPKMLQAWWDLKRQHPGPPDAQAGPAQVVRTGVPELVSRVDEAALERLTADPERREGLRRLGIVSYLCVPLAARDHCRGVLLLVNGPGRPALGPADLRFAQEIAERAARAVDNGLLYRAALEATRQSQEALRARAQFIATVSHEVRTPLNGIMGMTDLLRSTPLEPDQREFADAIQNSSEILLAMINDILDFARLEAGKLRLQAQDFEVRQVIRDVLEVFRPRAEARGLALRSRVEEGVPVRMHGDPIRLYQVLLNLVGNAVKFTPQGSVQLSCTCDEQGPGGSRLRFEVQDTGVGIDPAAQARLFEPFFQADPSYARRFEGAGLGLAVAHQIVSLMQGELGVASELGQGSTFWFTGYFLPAESPAPQVEEALRQGFPPGLKVLVAEDNPVNRRVMVLQLGRLGIQAVSVPDGCAALTALEGDRFHLVLMDCHMPVMDGFATTRELRNREAGRTRIPVVALTANVQEGAAQACLAAGMDDFVTKPIDMTRLAAVLHRLLDPLAGPAGPEPGK